MVDISITDDEIDELEEVKEVIIKQTTPDVLINIGDKSRNKITRKTGFKDYKESTPTKKVTIVEPKEQASIDYDDIFESLNNLKNP